MTSFPITPLNAFIKKSEAKSPIKIHLVEESRMEEWKKSQDKAVQNWLNTNQYKGKKGQFLAIPNKEGKTEDILCAIGHNDNLFALSSLAGTLNGHFELHHAALEAENLYQICLGWALGLYDFKAYKTAPAKDKKESLLVVPDQLDFDHVNNMATSVYLVRDMVNTPPNDMQPQNIEDIARDMAKTFKADLRVVTDGELVDQDYHAIYAVGKASENRPRLIDLTWGNAKDPKITLVGKGVCFDTGGLNLKGTSNMGLMKKDMGGSAQVMGVARMIMAMKLPVRLRVLIGAVENSVANNAYRPSDVIQTKKGLTVEITNTDAEGRLVLADCLAEACQEKPDLIVDFATLTGAARVALGPDLPPVFSNDEIFQHELVEISHRFQDPLWGMPLWDGYDSYMDSKVADMVNSASGSFAGAITAGLFLRRFVDEGQKWAHIDCYAWTPAAKPGKPVGGEAHGMRALYHYLEQTYKK